MIKRHWTPLYILNKIRNKMWERNNPNAPWLTPDAVNLLDELIKPSDIGLEFGSGRSTYWLAKRMTQLTSVEDNEQWFNRVRGIFNENKQLNVNYLHKNSVGQSEIENDYCNVISEFADTSLDFVLVDGTHRAAVTSLVLSKIKVGGLLVIDNVNWFLPHTTTAPSSVQSEQAIEEKWKPFYNQLHNWRLIWTKNGISDTAIFIRKV